MTDLPGPGPSQLAGHRDGNVPLPERRAPATVQVPFGSCPAAWQFWVAAIVGFFVIWLVSGVTGSPWFLWVAVPLVLIMLRRWLMDVKRGINENHREPR
jgi:hypothetical protein